MDINDNLVSIPEDAVNVLNKSLKHGLIKKSLTQGQVVNVMKHVLNFDRDFLYNYC